MNYLKKNITTLLPSYFALVMATGIVSMAADIFELSVFAKPLFYFNIGAYVILLIMLSLRLIFYLPQLKRDVFNSSRSFGFLTIVAATSILGQQFIIYEENYVVARILFYVAFFLWIVLIYMLFTIIAVNKEKLSLGQGMNAIWLLIVVATAAVSVLATDLANDLPISKEVVLFSSLLLFLVGCLMYVILITLIFYRLAFFPLHAAQFAPAYWINMGAVAILTLAGANLLEQGYSWEFLSAIEHFITGFVLLFWAMGTWWIPLIIILGAWRILKKVKPISYQAQYWGMVFPLGMYTVSTYRLSQVAGIDFLVNIPQIFVYFAILAWCITFLGLLLNIIYGFFGKYIPKGLKIPH